MKKLLLLLALLIWAGCSDDSGSSVHANGCHEETVSQDVVCDIWSDKYDAGRCGQLQNWNMWSTTIEVCDNNDGFF